MRKRHKPEQIVKKLREADAMLSGGAVISEVCRRMGVSEATYHRWRRQYGGVEVQALKRLKKLEQENARLKRSVADQAVDLSPRRTRLRLPQNRSSAVSEDPVDRPRDWDKCVSVAYLLAIGSNVKAAARAAGVGERTVHRWRTCSWWPQAEVEARRRWLNDASNKARGVVLRAIDSGDVTTAWKLLERTEPSLQAKALVEHRGSVSIGHLLATMTGAELEALEAMPDDQLVEALDGKPDRKR